MILDLDAGNTRVKWSVHQGSCRQSLAAGVVETGMVDALFSELPAGVERVRVASVVDAASGVIVAEAQQKWGVEPEFATVVDGCGGVTCAYSEPQRLGVDRWLGILAARELVQGDVIVVSAGSAQTVDLCFADGVHGGGYILPGQQMMKSSLLRDTAAVKFGGEVVATLAPGRSTSEAVANGCLAAAYGAVRALHGQYPATVVVTGGNGDELAAQLETVCPVIREPSLVLMGLAVALP